MYKTFALINIILASHSFLAAFLLIAGKKNRKATLYLGIINLMTGLMFLFGFLSLDRYYNNPSFMVYLIIPLLYFLIPLTYLYTFRLSRTETLNDGYHFIPAVLVSLYIVIRLLSGAGHLRSAVKDIFSLRYIAVDFFILLQIGLLLLGGYLLEMFLIIRSYNHDIRQMYSYLEKRNLRWLQFHLGIGTVGCFIFFAMNLLQYFLPSELAPILNNVEYTGQAVSIIFLLSIVYFTFSQNEIGEELPHIRKEIRSASGPVYSRQRLDPRTEKEYADRLPAFMTAEKPYLNPELTVNDLASGMGIPAARLTMILNMHVGKNFYQFVNSYRIRRACELMKDPRWADENILTIALEAGFNSKTSFNTYFKKIMGMTPREYRDKTGVM